jgi:hypothetical protein
MDSIHRWKQGWHRVQCIVVLNMLPVWPPSLSLTGQSNTKSQVRLSRAREEFWMALLYHQRRVTWRRVPWIYIIMVRVCVHDCSPFCLCVHAFILMACWNFMNVFLHVIYTVQFHSRFCFKCGHVVPILPITTWVSPSYFLWV